MAKLNFQEPFLRNHLICCFAVQETILIIINVKNSYILLDAGLQDSLRNITFKRKAFIQNRNLTDLKLLKSGEYIHSNTNNLSKLFLKIILRSLF